MGHCWRSKVKLISNFLQWTRSHGHASVGRLRRTYLKQLSTDTGCGLECTPEAIDDWDECVERYPKEDEYIERYTKKFLPLRWERRWLLGKMSDWCKISQVSIPRLKHLAGLAILKRCDTTKLSVEDDNIYIYIYIYIYYDCNYLLDWIRFMSRPTLEPEGLEGKLIWGWTKDSWRFPGRSLELPQINFGSKLLFQAKWKEIISLG